MSVATAVISCLGVVSSVVSDANQDNRFTKVEAVGLDTADVKLVTCFIRPLGFDGTSGRSKLVRDTD